MFLLTLRKNHFSNSIIKFLDPTPPFLYLNKCDISIQVQHKQQSETPEVALVTDTYAPTSKKYVPTEPKQNSFQ